MCMCTGYAAGLAYHRARSKQWSDAVRVGNTRVCAAVRCGNAVLVLSYL